MARVFSGQLITSVDVGTTKICVLIAQPLDGDQVEIVGIGTSPSDGLHKGVVVDIACTIHSIKTAIREAEIMAGHKVESVYVGISGSHIRSYNSPGVTPIKKGDVRSLDITNALASARAIPIKQGEEILHVLPQYFIIDGGNMLHDPLGMHGTRLEVQAHIITGQLASVKNLVRCCQMAGVEVKDIILEQLASAAAVLSPDERALGVGVLDIGGGTSDLALYQNGSIRHTKVLPVAGNHFTHDIAVGLRTTIADAERIKREYGVVGQMVNSDTLIEIEMVYGKQMRQVPYTLLVDILEP